MADLTNHFNYKNQILIKLIIVILFIYAVLIGIIFWLFYAMGKDEKNSTDITGNFSKYGFDGDGTKDSPYLISSVEDLEHFRNLVNEGESFSYTYFKQTENLDLSSVDNWTPIGVYGTEKYFYGYYDGNGHTLCNFTCIGQEDNGNVGLFGVLYGEVINLGIESGIVEGRCVGSIASHGVNGAVIANCYNKADVKGTRAGGIADNFKGVILFCFNFGEVYGETSAGITSYSCKEVSYCYSTTENLITSNFEGTIKNSKVIAKEELDEEFIREYYKALQNWNSGYVDTDNICKIVIKNGNIRFNESEQFDVLDEFSALGIILIILVLAMLVLVICDYITNIKWHKGEVYG